MASTIADFNHIQTYHDVPQTGKLPRTLKRLRTLVELYANQSNSTRKVNWDQINLKQIFQRINEIEESLRTLTPTDRNILGYDIDDIQSEPLSDKAFREIKERITKSLNERLPQANFTGLENATEKQLKEVKKILQDALNNFGKITVDSKLVLRCKLYSSDNTYYWRTWALTPANFQKLLDEINSNSFLFNWSESEDWQSDQATKLLPSWSSIRTFEITSIPEEKAEGERNIRQGGFFPYLLKPEIKSEPIINALARCQIFNSIEEHKDELNESCWIYAHRQAGVPSEIIDKMTLRIKTAQDSHIKLTEVIKLSHENGIDVDVRDGDVPSGDTFRIPKASERLPKNKVKYTIHINKFKDHYFLEFPTGLTQNYLDQYIAHNFNSLEVPDDCSTKQYKKRENGKYYWVFDKSKPATVSSYSLIKQLFNPNAFVPYRYEQYLQLPAITPPKIEDITDLHYNEDCCVRSYDELVKEGKKNTNWRMKQTAAVLKKKEAQPSNSPIEVSKVPETYWFGDTEADTVSNTYHVPYMFCVQSADGKIKATFKGPCCISEGINQLPHNAVVFFHNLGYDSRFFARFGASGRGIIKGNKNYSMNIEVGNKHIKLRDSLAIIPTALRNFPKMFQLPEQQKEVFPYQYYTVDRFVKKVGSISDAEQYLTGEDAEQFRKNIKAIPNCEQGKDSFDLQVYAEFYCQEDVTLLRLGYNKFREMVKEHFGLDTYKILTAPSLANAYFSKTVYLPLYQFKFLSGLPAEFIRKAVHGGRCMTARNLRWHVTERLVDFDAVSLYPSAIARLEIPTGPPRPLEPDELDMHWLDLNAFCYVVKVRFYPVQKHRDFPLFVVNDEDGNNLNTDTFTEPIIMYVTKIELEDIKKFYEGVKFDILQGYCYECDIDTRIQKVIKTIFSKRREFKAQKNPVQEIYKLIMNSAYGKTIQKFIDTEIKFFHNEEDLQKFWRKNYNFIDEDVQLCDSLVHKVTVRNPTNNQFSACIIGALILSMSKRIMNEVMCLAEDLGCKIYYQDTDSMHIREEDLPKLQAEYKKLYNKELVGKDMGQFHSDFDEAAGKWGLDPESAVSVESYFLAKKIYIDKLEDATGKVGYHVRMKGVPQEAIEEKANEVGGLMKLYERLYRGETFSFNLLAGGKPSFEYNSDYTITSRRSFNRCIQIKSPFPDDDSAVAVAESSESDETKDVVDSLSNTEAEETEHVEEEAQEQTETQADTEADTEVDTEAVEEEEKDDDEVVETPQEEDELEDDQLNVENDRPVVDDLFNDKKFIPTLPYYQRFCNRLVAKVNWEKDCLELFYLAEAASKQKSAIRGMIFQSRIFRYLQERLDPNNYFVYTEVPYDGQKLDIIVSRAPIPNVEKVITDADLRQCVFISVKTAVKNDWNKKDEGPAQTACGYILYTYGKRMSRHGKQTHRPYPTLKTWNKHIKNIQSCIVVHHEDFLTAKDANFVENDYNDHLKELVEKYLENI